MTTQAEITAAEVPFANTEIAFRAAAEVVHNLAQNASELTAPQKVNENKSYSLLLSALSAYHTMVETLATGAGFTIQSSPGPKQ